MTLPPTAPTTALMPVQPRVHDDRACELGEGALWHPGRQALFWFDILANRLLCRDADGPRAWQFDRHVSAAGWIDRDSLLIASETDLFRLDLQSGRQTRLVALEPDNPATRSNDGRADPQGGFWIGTMGKGGETGAGALYRWYRGELRCLRQGMTVPNAICFAPAGDLAQDHGARQRHHRQAKPNHPGPQIGHDRHADGATGCRRAVRCRGRRDPRPRRRLPSLGFRRRPARSGLPRCRG